MEFPPQPHDVAKRKFFQKRETSDESSTRWKRRILPIVAGFTIVSATGAAVNNWVDSKIEKSGDEIERPVNDAIEGAKDQFSTLIEEELSPIIDEKLEGAKQGFGEEMKATIDEFFAENFGIVPPKE